MNVYRELFDTTVRKSVERMCEEYSIECNCIQVGADFYYDVNEEKLLECLTKEISESDLELVQFAEKALNCADLNSSSQTDGFTAAMWSDIFDSGEDTGNYDTYSDSQFELALCQGLGGRENAIIEIMNAGIELGNL